MVTERHEDFFNRLEKRGEEELRGLNEDQKALASHIEGPCMGIAGPGSGKSFTIISRAAYMIKNGIDPENILMFTFTKKAAGELKERIEARMPEAHLLTVGTYHNFCSRLLRRYADYVGYDPSFTIYDTEDQEKLIKDIIDDPFFKPKSVLSKISSWKNQLISPKEAKEEAESPFERKMSEYYSEYEKQLLKQNAMDFDSLISLVIELLSENPSVKKEVNNRYKYVMADEVQDSSEKDLELIRLLAGDNQNICMIGDDAQSVYSFRGANLEAVLDLEKTYPDLKMFILRENYRSSSTIVDASMNIIAHNTNQVEKEVRTSNGEGEKIVYFENRDQASEARRVSQIITALVKAGHYDYKDFGILYRMTYLSKTVEEVFIEKTIPYTLIGGVPFYARKEVKDIMSYFRLAYNPSDIQSFSRSINTPKRGIGDKSLSNILSVANEDSHDKIDLIRSLSSEGMKEAVRGKAKKGLEEYTKIVANLEEEIEEGNTPSAIIDTIIEETNYMDSLPQDESLETRMDNIERLRNIAEAYETVDDFIYNMSLSSLDEELSEEEEEPNQVQLMTMHASKGLEFPVVIVIGANEGITPHHKADTGKAIAEERRLFYVAVSRAEEMIFINSFERALVMGQWKNNRPSRFIAEIGEHNLIRR